MKVRIDEIIEKIREAQSANATMQSETEPGSAAWHAHETIDDKLHDALTLIGD